MKPLHQSLVVMDDEWSETAFNYGAAFQCMNQRRMQRQFQGVYPGPSKWMTILAQLVWLYTVVVILLTNAKTTPHEQVTMQSAVLTLAALVGIQFIAHRQRSRLLLLMAYCAVIAHVTFFAIFNDAGLFEITSASSTHPTHPAQSTALIALAVAEAVILFVYGVVYHLYPFVVAREWIDTHAWFAIKRGRRANTITYRAFSLHWPWASRNRYTIEYTGGLDEQFRPHGFGIWKDSSYHGEMLVGAWEHGIPIGPFTSREHGTGYASQQIRVAYGAYRSEARPDQRYYVPKIPTDKAIQWGVAHLECSVAGGFFRFLPRVGHFFSRANAPRSASECVKILRTPLDNIFYRDTETHEIVSDHTVPATQYSESIEPTTLTKLEKKASHHDREKEALVFVHGIDNSLNDAIKLCGQLVARGDFPSEIHPFVFSWPSGNSPIPSYWMTKQIAESDDVASGLQAFVASILEAGYTKVNFVTHSMGTRVFLYAVERKKFKNLFQNGSFATQASMSTVTLCSPEFPLARFIAAGGTFDILREYCAQITIYGDESDLALRGSELANRDWKQCSPLVKSLGCNIKNVVRDASFSPLLDPVCVPVAELVKSTSETASLAAVNQAAGFRHVASFTACVIQPVPEPDPMGYGSMQEYDDDEGGNHVTAPRMYVDVDVINTSFTDINVGSNRHSYFRMNESIVEDIRELILHKRRARGRAGLMYQRGNVFIFLTAPKDIV